MQETDPTLLKLYTARDAVGGTWGPSSGDPAAVPFPVVGVSGGALGWDSNVEQSDTEICGDGTYTIFVSSHGTIDTEGSGWYIDKEKKYTRLGCPWSMLGTYECVNDLTTEPKQEELKWKLSEKNRDRAFSFNLVGVCTDIPVTYDKDEHKCYLDADKTQEITVSNVVVDLCGKTYKADVGLFEEDKFLQISLINIWGRSTIEETAYPEQDGRISVTFTVKGLDAKTDLAKKSKVTVAKKKAYTGKALKPAVTVKVGSKTLKKGTDYTLSYKNNKKPGKATVTVKGKGNYTGKKTASFVIVPKKQAAPAVKALGNQKIKVTVKKDKLSSGYKVQYSTDKKFKKGVKTAAISKNSTTSKTIAKLTKGKTYYVRTAAYVKVGKKSYAGAYSKAKAVKVKEYFTELTRKCHRYHFGTDGFLLYH